jgi:hypothetical protein
MTNVIQLEKKSEPNKLRCTSCGTTVDAPCDCGVPFEFIKAKKLAEIGIKETPAASNRAIADRMGISHVTVKNERDKQLLNDLTVTEPETRIGSDGIERRLPRARLLPNGRVQVDSEWLAQAEKKIREDRAREERDNKYIPPSKDALKIMCLMDDLKRALPALERLDRVNQEDITEVEILLQQAQTALNRGKELKCKIQPETNTSE